MEMVCILSHFISVQLLATPWTGPPPLTFHQPLESWRRGEARELQMITQRPVSLWTVDLVHRGFPRQRQRSSSHRGTWDSVEIGEHRGLLEGWDWRRECRDLAQCRCWDLTQVWEDGTVLPKGKGEDIGGFRLHSPEQRGLPGDSEGKESACGRPEFDPWVRKIPWKRGWQPTPVFWPGEFHGQRNLVGYSPWVAKSWTQLSDWYFHFHSEWTGKNLFAW